jgi:hypothetical protein
MTKVLIVRGGGLALAAMLARISPQLVAACVALQEINPVGELAELHTSRGCLHLSRGETGLMAGGVAAKGKGGKVKYLRK